MPLPNPNPSKRMTANPARPVARYRPGKAVRQDSSSEEDESEAEAEEVIPQRSAPPQASSFPSGAQRRQALSKQARKEQSEDEEGFVTEEEEGQDADTLARQGPGAGVRANKTQARVLPISLPDTTDQADEGSEDGGGSEDSEEDSTEEEESTSEEEPQRTFQRPTFIKKSDRGKLGGTETNGSEVAVSNGVISTVPVPDVAEIGEARRKEMANLMIKDKLERDAAARAAGRKGWDDDEEVAAEDMVDDTDGLDPQIEYAAWKLRELKRLKRDREAIEQREKEIEEIERRRNLTQAERDAEDREYLEQQQEEREEGRGKSGFLQRYHHKGAFFQDDETAEILRKRDLMGAKFVDQVQNREALPQYMQVRDMTKLGRKGRTRYTDLRGEDTGKWAQGYDERARRGPKTDFGVDERFRPDHDGGTKGPTGANACIVRDGREKRVELVPGWPRAIRNGDKSVMSEEQGVLSRPQRQLRERYDNRDDGSSRVSPSPRRRRSPRTSRSRSTSENEDKYGGQDSTSRRKRSLSPYMEIDKRRRVGAS